jgi:hypothetical protein
VHPSRLNDEDYIEFDHFVVSRIEPGKLWLAQLRRSAGRFWEILAIQARKSLIFKKASLKWRK